jgi:hypothetical protein
LEEGASPIVLERGGAAVAPGASGPFSCRFVAPEHHEPQLARA